MKGLELSRRYFEAYGRDMIAFLEARYPALKGQFAAGLVGQGSECLGFDDELSADHDFGPSFCVWLPKNLYHSYGKLCQQAYDRLPGDFMGFSARKVMPNGQDRVGVLCTEDFYYNLLGLENPPSANTEWMMLSESSLSQASGGEMFLDDNGSFTAFRDQLLGYYPEDVRKKKIAARAVLMAQSGQYNYSRLCRRGEWTGAALSLAEFIKAVCSMINLLNCRYTPFYKWMHRSLQDMPILPQIYDLLDQLSESSDNRSAWIDVKQEDYLYGFLNQRDKNAVLIETICQLVIRELKVQGLSDSQDIYLEPHGISVMNKIEDPLLRSLPVLYG